MTAPLLELLRAPPPQLFFTGKGGVGKTSLAGAVAIALADVAKRVLLVSTDPASNLDEMFGQTLTDTPRPISGVRGLSAMDIDPEAAAEAYRSRVLAQLAPDVTEMERATVREQLSGACTTEIAAFDEFAGQSSRTTTCGRRVRVKCHRDPQCLRSARPLPHSQSLAYDNFRCLAQDR